MGIIETHFLDYVKYLSGMLVASVGRQLPGCRMSAGESQCWWEVCWSLWQLARAGGLVACGGLMAATGGETIMLPGKSV